MKQFLLRKWANQGLMAVRLYWTEKLPHNDVR
jgi:hypothetical protein